MGASNAQGFADAARERLISQDAGLKWHLFSNHYPPLPRGVLALAKEAIANATEGEWDKPVDTEGVAEHRVYGTKVPTAVCIKAWHLQPFLTWEVE